MRAYHSDEFVAFTHQSLCACGCGGSPCEVSHDPSRGAGGTWKDTHPLTPACHRELHSKGTQTFWASRGMTREDANRRHHYAWLAYIDSGEDE